jgi:hypothetical protein
MSGEIMKLEIGKKVEVKWGGDWWNAEIVDISEVISNRILIHYEGGSVVLLPVSNVCLDSVPRGSLFTSCARPFFCKFRAILLTGKLFVQGAMRKTNGLLSLITLEFASLNQ